MACGRRGYQVAAALLTFWAYAAIHMTRKALSEVKPDLVVQWTTGQDPFFQGATATHDAKAFLSTLDAVFMFAYAAGLILAGDLGDRINLRLLLSGCMCASAVVVVAFGVGGVIGVRPWYFGVMWTLNGVVQSACWPAVVAVMGNWWGKSVRGAAMGLWSGNASAGNAISGIVCGALLNAGFSWEVCMYVTGGVLFASGLLMFFAIVPHPRDVGLEPSHEMIEPKTALLIESSINGDGGEDLLGMGDEGGGELLPATSMGVLVGIRAEGGELGAVVPDGGTEEAGETAPSAAGFCTALMLPGTLIFSLCYMALKSVNYTLMFALPLFLSSSTNLPTSRADFYSTLNDVGGIAGSFIGGSVTDCFSRRSPIVVVQLVCAIPVLLAFGLFDLTDGVIVGLSLTTGLLIGGAANLVSSVFAVEIAEQVHRVEGGRSKQAVATVTGIIDGLASIGAGVVLQLAGIIPQAYLFDMLSPLAGLSALCLVPVLWRDIQAMRKGARA